ncbi:hypothetical protein ACTNC1_05905 [Atopobiaceae bacterium HCP3S3_A4]
MDLGSPATEKRILLPEAVFVCVSEHLLFHEALIRACKDKEDAGLRKEPVASNLKRGDEACIALCGIEEFIEDKYKMHVFRLLGNECKCSIQMYLCCEDKCRLVSGKLFREGSLAVTTPAIEDDHLEAALGIEPLELTELMLASDEHAASSLHNLD